MGSAERTRDSTPRGPAILFASFGVPILFACSCGHDWSRADDTSDGVDESGEGETGGEGDADGDAIEEAEGVGETDVAGDEGVDGLPDDGGPLCGNGVIDPGEDCEGDDVLECMTGCGTLGRRACMDCGWVRECVPPAEACNQADDDCDTATDEDFECIRGARVGCTNPCLVPGTQICASDCTLPDQCCIDRELCDCGLCDDNCDTRTDEGCTPC